MRGSRLFMFLALSWFVGWPGPVAAQPDDRYQLRLECVYTGVGAKAEVPVVLDAVQGTLGFPEAMTGWSFGICNDAALTLNSVALGTATATANGGSAPDFSAVNMTPGMGNGFTWAVVISHFGQHTLPPGTGLEMLLVSYTVNGTPGQTLPLQFCSTLGVPAMAVQIGLAGGSSIEPEIQDCDVTVLHNYVRGDCTGDASVNLTDAVYSLSYLFGVPGTAPPECARACDADASGSLNILDPVTTLQSLFGPMPTPLAPPNTCGVDGLPSLPLDCVEVPQCP